MKKQKLVQIGNKKVPVMDGGTMAVFSAGRAGPQEKGTYRFWTAVCIVGKKEQTVFGRALVKLDAGERFRRIGLETKSAATAADRRAYTKFWTYLQGVVYVRPATVIEVASWLYGHGEDAIHLKSLRFL